MPILRRDPDALPYVRPAYEPDTRTLRDLMALAGQSRVSHIGRQGQSRSEGLMTLGQIISQGLAGIRRDREAQQAAAAQAQLKREEMNKPVAVAGALVRPMTGDVVYSTPEKSEGFSLSPGQRRYDATGREIASAPEPVKAPEGFSLSPGQRRFDAAGKEIASVAERPEREPNPTEASLASMAARGDRGAAKALDILRNMRASDNAPEKPSVWLTKDGRDAFVSPSQAAQMVAQGWKKPAGESKPASGLEKRALNFFNRAQQADTDLEGMEADISKMGLGDQAYMQWAPNFMQTDLGQKYQQAQRAFTEARLRKDSGAAIPEPEFESDRKTYFAQPGDTAETLEQKRRARGAILASLGFESGQALSEFLGNSDEASRMVQGYRERSQKKPDSAALKVRMKAPDGSVQDVDPSMVEHYKRLGATVVK